jgi:hypothetical protein
MRKIALNLLLLLLLPALASADSIGYRLNSAIQASDTALVEFPGGGAGPGEGVNGKTMHVFYDRDITTNFYIEGALGYLSPNDIFEYSSMMYEISPGVQTSAGPVSFRLSIGGVYMPENNFNPATFEGYRQLDFAIHFGVGITDPHTGVRFTLERTHYSNGFANNNPSLNFAGFTLSVPVKF